MQTGPELKMEKNRFDEAALLPVGAGVNTLSNKHSQLEVNSPIACDSFVFS